jgi:type I restriction enzyme R subunit
LASPHPETIKIKDDIMFFEMIKKMIVKYSSTSRKEISRELEYEISQLISRSISSEEPVDIFSLLKKEKPDISILNEELLSKIANLVQKNYAVDLLMKLIKDEIKTRIRINPYRYKSLYERLQKLIEKYNIKLISTVDVINELIEIAKEIKKKLNEGKELDLTEEELAFYDMLLKEGVFRNKEEIIYVVKEIKKQLGHFVKIVDWNKKETLRARIKVAIKEILAKVLEKRVGYEKINKITSEIYEQIEMLHAA